MDPKTGAAGNGARNPASSIRPEPGIVTTGGATERCPPPLFTTTGLAGPTRYRPCPRLPLGCDGSVPRGKTRDLDNKWLAKGEGWSGSGSFHSSTNSATDSIPLPQ